MSKKNSEHLVKIIKQVEKIESKNISNCQKRISESYNDIHFFKHNMQSINKYISRLPNRVKQSLETQYHPQFLNGLTYETATIDTVRKEYLRTLEQDTTYAIKKIEESVRLEQKQIDIQCQISLLEKRYKSPIITSYEGGLILGYEAPKNCSQRLKNHIKKIKGEKINHKWYWSLKDILNLSNNNFVLQHVNDIPLFDTETETQLNIVKKCHELINTFGCIAKIDLIIFYDNKTNWFPIKIKFPGFSSICGKRIEQIGESKFKVRYTARELVKGFTAKKIASPPTTRKEIADKRNVSFPNDKKKIYVLATSNQARGYHDFLSCLDQENKKAINLITLSPDFSDTAILNKIHKYNITNGDYLCLVCGGGDVSNDTFRPFFSFDAMCYLHQLKDNGVVIITGLGHSTDHFTIELAATYNEITPTAAVYKLNQLLKSTKKQPNNSISAEQKRIVRSSNKLSCIRCFSQKPELLF